jgi:hypothetical protein
MTLSAGLETPKTRRKKCKCVHAVPDMQNPDVWTSADSSFTLSVNIFFFYFGILTCYKPRARRFPPP